MTWNYSEIAENNQPDGIKLPDEQNVIKKMKENERKIYKGVFMNFKAYVEIQTTCKK